MLGDIGQRFAESAQLRGWLGRFLLADDSLRTRMGLNARKRIEESFSWEVAAKKTLEVYREVV